MILHDCLLKIITLIKSNFRRKRRKFTQPTISTMPSLWQRQKKVIIAIVVIAVLAVGSVSAALLLRPASQFTIPLWYNSDGHYGDTEPTVAQVIANAIEKTRKINGKLNA